MRITAKAIDAQVGQINKQYGGNSSPVYGDIVPGTDARYIERVIIDLAPGTEQAGDDYILPNGWSVKVGTNGTLNRSEFVE